MSLRGVITPSTVGVMTDRMIVQNQPVVAGQPVHLRHGGDKTFWVQSFHPNGVTVHVLNEHDVELDVPRSDVIGVVS